MLLSDLVTKTCATMINYFWIILTIAIPTPVRFIILNDINQQRTQPESDSYSVTFSDLHQTMPWTFQVLLEPKQFEEPDKKVTIRRGFIKFHPINKPHLTRCHIRSYDPPRRTLYTDTINHATTNQRNGGSQQYRRCLWSHPAGQTARGLCLLQVWQIHPMFRIRSVVWQLKLWQPW